MAVITSCHLTGTLRASQIKSVLLRFHSHHASFVSLSLLIPCLFISSFSSLPSPCVILSPFFCLRWSSGFPSSFSLLSVLLSSYAHQSRAFVSLLGLAFKVTFMPVAELPRSKPKNEITRRSFILSLVPCTEQQAERQTVDIA